MRGFKLGLLLIGLVLFAGTSLAAGLPEFSAKNIVTTKSQKIISKVNFSTDKWRIETQVSGRTSISIMRADKKVMWMLMPEQKMYVETKMTEKQTLGKTEKMAGEVSRKKVGREKINGITCDKYLITYMANDKKESVYQWISGDKIPMKTAAIDGSWSSEYTDLKKGKQVSALFEIPAGYKKMDIPMMPQ